MAKVISISELRTQYDSFEERPQMGFNLLASNILYLQKKSINTLQIIGSSSTSFILRCNQELPSEGINQTVVVKCFMVNSYSLLSSAIEVIQTQKEVHCISPVLEGYDSFLMNPDDEVMNIIRKNFYRGSISLIYTMNSANGLPAQFSVIRSWICQLIEAVADLHERSLAHSGIKASNIFIDETKNQIRLLDFGFGRREAVLKKKINEKNLVTPPCPPETLASVQFQDVYSLMIIIYQMTFGFDCTQEIIKSLQSGVPFDESEQEENSEDSEDIEFKYNVIKLMNRIICPNTSKQENNSIFFLSDVLNLKRCVETPTNSPRQVALALQKIMSSEQQLPLSLKLNQKTSNIEQNSIHDLTQEQLYEQEVLYQQSKRIKELGELEKQQSCQTFKLNEKQRHESDLKRQIESYKKRDYEKYKQNIQNKDDPDQGMYEDEVSNSSNHDQKICFFSEIVMQSLPTQSPPKENFCQKNFYSNKNKETSTKAKAKDDSNIQIRVNQNQNSIHYNENGQSSQVQFEQQGTNPVLEKISRDKLTQQQQIRSAPNFLESEKFSTFDQNVLLNNEAENQQKYSECRGGDPSNQNMISYFSEFNLDHYNQQYERKFDEEKENLQSKQEQQQNSTFLTNNLAQINIESESRILPQNQEILNSEEKNRQQIISPLMPETTLKNNNRSTSTQYFSQAKEYQEVQLISKSQNQSPKINQIPQEIKNNFSLQQQQNSLKNLSSSSKMISIQIDSPSIETVRGPSGQIIYEGKLVDQKKNGYGILFDEEGRKQYEGYFLNDSYHGQGLEYYETGQIMNDGYFEEGFLNGQAKSYNKDGSLLYQGIYQQGVCHGEGIKFLNGKIFSKGTYVNGKMNGKFQKFYENGQVQFEGSYFKNKRNGQALEYYENGVLAFQGIYEKGRKEEGTQYDQNGKIIFQGKFEDDQDY